MIDHRQGNDLAVLWSIFKDGEPFDLRGRSLKLYLKNLHERKEVVDFSVTGNEIHWTFYGKDQDALGKHSLILVANEDEKGMITTDACDFVRLVSCSCKLQGGEDAPNVETESIELTSTLEYVAGGGDYDDTALWRALDGKVDKVEGLGLSEENYTTEEKEKLAGLENYDDSGIKGELAKKVESEVVVDTESTEDFEFGYDDTEIRQEIAELSAEVSGLSERVDELEEGASANFKAIYGETTIEEVTEAYNQGKVIHCDYNGMCFVLSAFNGGQAFFTSLSANYSTRLELKSDSRWAISYFTMEENKNKVKTINESSTDTQYPSAKAVYDALQQSATPSGDPMHYIFEAAGATYNATDEDIPMVSIYGDSYVHKAHHWHLNELGDITTEEMRQIYLYANLDNGAKGVTKYLAGIEARTNIATWTSSWNGKIKDQEAFAYAYNVIVARMRNKEHYIDTNASFAFTGCTALQKILPTLDATSTTSFNGIFNNCNNLREVRIKNIKVAIKFDKSPLISKASILYLIQNSAATSAMVITLHADAYSRLAEDADIVAALAEKTNVSLAK